MIISVNHQNHAVSALVSNPLLKQQIDSLSKRMMSNLSFTHSDIVKKLF